jgi:putative Mn2+ efflux pump MntP
MKVIRWAERRTKALTIWDVGVLKIYCVLFGMIVGAYLSSFVRQEVWWFVAAVLVLGGGLGYRWLTAEPR